MCFSSMAAILKCLMCIFIYGSHLEMSNFKIANFRVVYHYIPHQNAFMWILCVVDQIWIKLERKTMCFFSNGGHLEFFRTSK